jgi:hypothetical protein
MTARQAINAMLRYLRTEQRTIPYAGGTYDDPLPDAIDAMNGALQQMAVFAPLFAVKQQRSAWFRAPATVAVTGLSNGALSASADGTTWPAWAAGCMVQLPGDPAMNRIVELSADRTAATLQFPHLSSTASGTATVHADCVELDSDIITVLEPVRPRGSRRVFLPAGGREELASVDASQDTRYFVETAATAAGVRLRLMLSGAVVEDLLVEFQARTALSVIATADIYDEEDPDEDPGRAIPVPTGFVESIFLPLATDLFFSKPCITNHDVSPLRNQDAVKLVREQAQRALAMLEAMRPQGQKPARVVPGW